MKNDIRKMITIIKNYGNLNENVTNDLENQISENFFDKFKKKELYKDSPNVWTHATNEESLINLLKNGKKFIGNKEDISQFNVPQVGKFKTYVNLRSPNFMKGGIFSGFEAYTYLITTELPDTAFQPNWNGKNYNNFNDSQNVGVLKPEYRDSKYFKLWKKNKNNQFELIQ